MYVVSPQHPTITTTTTPPHPQVTGAISSKKHNLHESAMIALKTIVGQLPATPNNTAATTVITTAVPLLVEGIYPDLPTEVLNAALESLSEILAKGGALTTTQHKDILTATMAVLQEGKPTSRKRAIQCLGVYMLVCTCWCVHVDICICTLVWLFHCTYSSNGMYACDIPPPLHHQPTQATCLHTSQTTPSTPCSTPCSPNWDNLEAAMTSPKPTS